MLALVPDKVRGLLDQEWRETEMTSNEKWDRLYTEVKVNLCAAIF